MQEIVISQVVLSAIIATVIEVLKGLGVNLKKEFVPVLSVLVGILGNFLYTIYLTGNMEFNIINSLVAGAIAGWIASGGYDFAKSLKKMTEGEKAK